MTRFSPEFEAWLAGIDADIAAQNAYPEAWAPEAYENESEREEREATMADAWREADTLTCDGEPVAWAMADDEWQAMRFAY